MFVSNEKRYIIMLLNKLRNKHEFDFQFFHLLELDGLKLVELVGNLHIVPTCVSDETSLFVNCNGGWSLFIHSASAALPAVLT